MRYIYDSENDNIIVVSENVSHEIFHNAVLFRRGCKGRRIPFKKTGYSSRNWLLAYQHNKNYSELGDVVRIFFEVCRNQFRKFVKYGIKPTLWYGM